MQFILNSEVRIIGPLINANPDRFRFNLLGVDREPNGQVLIIYRDPSGRSAMKAKRYSETVPNHLSLEIAQVPGGFIGLQNMPEGLTLTDPKTGRRMSTSIRVQAGLNEKNEPEVSGVWAVLTPEKSTGYEHSPPSGEVSFAVIEGSEIRKAILNSGLAGTPTEEALTRFEQKDYERVERILKRELELGTLNELDCQLLARSYAIMGRHGEGIDMITTALKAAPQWENGRAILASLLGQIGRFDEARAAIRQIPRTSQTAGIISEMEAEIGEYERERARSR